LVLDLEATNLPDEFLLGRSGEDEHQGPIDVPHRVNLRKLRRERKMASFSHTGSWFGRRILDGPLDRTASARLGHVRAAAA
jgi:hypothetical protein